MWAVTQQNWPVVKEKLAWAIPQEKNTQSVRPGDNIIFYVIGSNHISGIYEITSEWHESTVVWPDKNDTKQVLAEIDLKEVQLGEFDVRKNKDHLKFIKDPKNWGRSFQALGGLGVSNHGMPIPHEDYEFILEKLKNSPNNSKKLEIHDLISNIDLGDVRFQTKQAPEQLERVSVTISKIITKIQDTEWVIPNFQRGYDWKHEDVRELLTSIFMEQYVGSLLLWDPDKDEKMDVIPVHGVEEKSVGNNYYVVLDGQQRITSLNYVINPPDSIDKKDKDKFPGYFYVDLKVFLQDLDTNDLIIRSKEKLNEQEIFDRFLFPLYMLEGEKINQWSQNLAKQFEGSDLEIKLIKIGNIVSNKMFRIISQFHIPYVVLPKSIEFDSVARIFENLNSKGIELGTFDLLNVRLSRYDVQLKSLWDETRDEYDKIKEYFEETPEIARIRLYIIEAMSLVFTELKSCKRKDILDLYVKNKYEVSDFEAKWKTMSASTQAAIDYIEDKIKGFGAISKRDLPYIPIIPVLAAMLKEVNRNHKDQEVKCMKKISNWYWTTVFAMRYSAAVDTKKSKDYKEMLQWFNDDMKIPGFIQNFRKDYINLHLSDVQSSGSSIYKGIFSLLNKNGADDLERQIIMDDGRLHKDHIFPKSKFKDPSNRQNSILNMTYLTRTTNAVKKAKLPSKYIRETIADNYNGNEDEFLVVLERHLINKKCLEHLKNDEFEEFLAERSKILISEIGKCIGAEKP